MDELKLIVGMLQGVTDGALYVAMAYIAAGVLKVGAGVGALAWTIMTLGRAWARALERDSEAWALKQELASMRDAMVIGTPGPVSPGEIRGMHQWIANHKGK